MASAETQSWTVEQVVSLLERVPLFQGLSRPDLERVASLVRGRTVRENELLFREGDRGDKFYIVFRGAVEILKERPRGDHERLAVKREGEPFGEMSLLTDAPRSASARAVEPTQLLVVSKADFDTLLGGESLAVRLMRQLAKALHALDVRFAAKGAGGGAASAMHQFSQLVQRGLLPRHSPEVVGYELAGGLSHEDSGLGRSVWDFSRLASGELCVAVMDVKGTGLPPAYSLGVTRALLRQITAEERDLAATLSRLNSAVAENMLEGVDECVEVALASFGPEGARLCVAGEQPIVLVRANGEVQTLKSQGLALGIVPTFKHREMKVPLASGDALVLFSEAEAGLLKGAADLILSRRQESAEALVEMLRTALSRAATKGDLTFIVAKRK